MSRRSKRRPAYQVRELAGQGRAAGTFAAEDLQEAARRCAAARAAGRSAYVAAPDSAARLEPDSRRARTALLEVVAGVFLIAGLLDLSTWPARGFVLLSVSALLGTLARLRGSSSA